MSFDPPPANIPFRDDHPQPPVGVHQNSPLQTNKFYANFFAGKQANPTWTYPYSVWWSPVPTNGSTRRRGLSISHTDREDFIYGPVDPVYNVSVESFSDTSFREAISLAAVELGRESVLTLDSLTASSVNVNLAPRENASTIITFPLVQGMGFVTGIYKDASVLIQTGLEFATKSSLIDLGPVSTGPAGVVYGWSVSLNDTSTWLVYITPGQKSSLRSRTVQPTLQLVDKHTIVGPTDFRGTVQIAKNPLGQHGHPIYHAAAGAYPGTGHVAGSVAGRTGTYSLSWTKEGVPTQQLLMFALPHHVESFDDVTASRITALSLAGTTKGITTGVLTDSFTMVEPDLPTEIGFDPWSPRFGSVGSADAPGGPISASARARVSAAGRLELRKDVGALTNLESKYFSGIAFSVYARALYATSQIAEDKSAFTVSLQKLKDAFQRYVDNLEVNPLAYDTVWGGVVSTASYGTDNPYMDFGSTHYNDHNFHYGYYVYVAAIIGYLDPAWLTANDSANTIWVNTLIRDWANPSAEDPYFPFSRSYDFYHGHSWARGVIESEVGKDQESSAEDAFSTYAIKMWGRTIGDPVMEARGNLQLAITARALQNYYLYESDNAVQPPEFIGVKAAGILFDKYINHTTYFGDQVSFVQGIHMLPSNPSSAYTRTGRFVREEWDLYFAGNRTGALAGGGYIGHLYTNLAIADVEGAKESYEFMSRQMVNGSAVDSQSLAWNLAYSAALGGSLPDASGDATASSSWSLLYTSS